MKFTVNNLTVTIKQDQNAEMPFGNGVSIYYRKASRYTLGTDKLSDTDLQKMEGRVNKGELYGLPIYAYVHGVVALGTSPFDCPWDSGRSGIAVAAKSDFASEAEAHAAIRALVTEFNQYMGGDVWGFAITDEDGNELDSCWGFYGIEYCKEQATEAAQSISKNLETSCAI